jgi:hypothetical protein
MAIPQVQPLLRLIEMSRSRFLYGLEQTPDDRLAWSPGEAAAPPLKLADKLAGMILTIAHLIEHHAFPERPATPPPPSDREAARAAITTAFERLQSVISQIKEADLQTQAPAPWGAMVPLTEWLWWVSSALGYMQGQLNYLQTAYGDMDPNIPPDWGREAG